MMLESGTPARRSKSTGGGMTEFTFRLEAIEKSQEQEELTLHEIRATLSSLDKTEAVRIEKDKAVDLRLKNIEKSIGGVYKAFYWFLAAVGIPIVAAVVAFTLRGGWNIGS